MSVFSPRPLIRHATAVTAAAALSAVALVSPSAFAQEGSSAQTESPIFDQVLGVGADETQVKLAWATGSAGKEQEYVQYAPARAQSGAEFPVEEAITVGAKPAVYVSPFKHVTGVTISGLAEDTEYVYRVGSEERGWSISETFGTGTYGDTWDFLFYGDPQIGASGDAAADGSAWRRAVANSTATHPDASLLLSAGDQVDHATSDAEYAEFFSPEALDEIRFAPNNGNHDFYNWRYGYHFNLPNTPNSQTVEGIARPKHYYFEHNNVLFVALDTNYRLPHQLDEQEQFLRDTVAAHGDDNDWVVVTYHHSTYSQAYHQGDPVVQDYRARMVDVFSEVGVDLVLGGHDHIHTRSHLMNHGVPVEPEGPAGPGDVLYPEAEEVLYLAANSASGSKYYPFWHDGTEYPQITTMEQSDALGLTAPHSAFWMQDHTPDYTHIEVSPTELSLTTYNVDDGSVVDQITLAKRVPSAPGDFPAESSPNSASSSLSSR